MVPSMSFLGVAPVGVANIGEKPSRASPATRTASIASSISLCARSLGAIRKASFKLLLLPRLATNSTAGSTKIAGAIGATIVCQGLGLITADHSGSAPLRAKNFAVAASLLDDIVPPGWAILGAARACSAWPCLSHSLTTVVAGTRSPGVIRTASFAFCGFSFAIGAAEPHLRPRSLAAGHMAPEEADSDDVGAASHALQPHSAHLMARLQLGQESFVVETLRRHHAWKAPLLAGRRKTFLPASFSSWWALPTSS